MWNKIWYTEKNVNFRVDTFNFTDVIQEKKWVGGGSDPIPPRRLWVEGTALIVRFQIISSLTISVDVHSPMVPILRWPVEIFSRCPPIKSRGIHGCVAECVDPLHLNEIPRILVFNGLNTRFSNASCIRMRFVFVFYLPCTFKKLKAPAGQLCLGTKWTFLGST